MGFFNFFNANKRSMDTQYYVKSKGEGLGPTEFKEDTLWNVYLQNPFLRGVVRKILLGVDALKTGESADVERLKRDFVRNYIIFGYAFICESQSGLVFVPDHTEYEIEGVGISTVLKKTGEDFYGVGESGGRYVAKMVDTDVASKAINTSTSIVGSAFATLQTLKYGRLRVNQNLKQGGVEFIIARDVNDVSMGAITNEQRTTFNSRFNAASSQANSNSARDFKSSTSDGNKIEIIDVPIKVHPLRQSANQLGANEAMDFAIMELASLFSVPIELVDSRKSTYNNKEIAREILRDEVCIPYANIFLDAYNDLMGESIKFQY